MPWLVFFTLCFATLTANSKNQEPPVEQLLNIEIAAYQLSSSFSAYVQFNGSPKFADQLETTINNSHKIFDQTNEKYPAIFKKWQESLGFIEDKKGLVFGGEDHRLITGHAIYQNQLYKLIQAAQINTESDPSQKLPNQHEYLNIRVSFERVIAQYIGFTGSATGFIHSDFSIEDSVAAFTNNINKITNKNSDFQRLNKKWNFIKGNITTEANHTTPFITLHTAADIRKTLQRLYKNELISTAEL